MKLAAIDLDGTLLRSDCSISEYSAATIKKAFENDILVIPTSGRSFRSIMRYAGSLYGIRYTIGANGSVITQVKGEQVIYEDMIPRETAYAIYRHITDTGGFLSVYSGNDSYIENGGDAILHATKVSKAICDDLLSTDVRILSMDQLIRRGTMNVNKFFFSYIRPEDNAACVEWLGQFDDISYGYSTDYTVEIFPKTSNKDIALDYLRQSLGLSKEATIGIGDSENDLALIQYAHLGVAVENGMDILKKNADYIAPANDNDGPAIVLEGIMTGKIKI